MMGSLTSIVSVVGQAVAPVADGGGLPWLTLITFAPLVGVFALMLVSREQQQVLRNIAFSVSLLVFVISLGPLLLFNPAMPWVEGAAFTFQLVEGPTAWIPSIGIQYMVGIDGISLWLVLLTTFLMPLVILSTYDSVNRNVKEYMIALLFLETGMLGALVAMDVFLFYVFWEMMLIPMYLIIGVWGGEERVRAAVKFFIYTMVGSLLMLVSILYVYFKGGDAGQYSFLFTDMLAVELTVTEQVWLFAAFFLAFAIKVPLFPFHTWLPLAHVQAPTAGSVILAGVLLKMGTYGLVRYAFPLFPDALQTFAPYIACLAVIGILYGALVAMVQPDVKKLVAYSSVSHLGFCVLGLIAMTPQGLTGGIFVMIAHGIATGGLFFCVGILYDRRHSKKIADFGGISKVMPVFATLFMVIVFASVGLPGLNGFVGEFLVLIGASRSHFLWFDEPVIAMRAGEPSTWSWSGVSPEEFLYSDSLFRAGPEITAIILTAFATLGVIFAAGYLLWMWRRVMFGPIRHEENRGLSDVSPRELGYLIPIVLMAIFMGVYPKFFLSRIEPSTNQFLSYIQKESSDGSFVRAEPLDDPEYIPKSSILDADELELDLPTP